MLPDIKYAQWVRRSIDNDSQFFPGIGSYETIGYEWARFEPLTHAWKNLIGDKHWSHLVMTKDGIIQTSSSWTECMFTPNRFDFNHEYLLNHIHVPTPENIEELLLENKKTKGGWLVKKEEFDGKETLRYDIERIESNFIEKFTYWVDPATKLFIQREIVNISIESKQQVTKTVYENFEYNIKPKDEVFQMPEGRPIKENHHSEELDAKWNSIMEDHGDELIDILRSLDKSWQESNFTNFAAIWDFELLDESKDYWKTKIEEQKDIWETWNQTIRTGMLTDDITIPMSSNTFTGRKIDHELLHVFLDLNAETKIGNQKFQLITSIYLKLFSEGYKIVKWDVPLDGIEYQLDESTQ